MTLFVDAWVIPTFRVDVVHTELHPD